jgi:hypothetical protein
MERYILRYKGRGPKPSEDVERIRSLPNTTVLDDSARMLLVASPESELRTLIDSMPDWVMSPEQITKLPDPHPKILRDPDEVKTSK